MLWRGSLPLSFDNGSCQTPRLTFVPPVNLWQCLETFLGPTWGEGAAGVVREGQRCCGAAVMSFPQVRATSRVEMLQGFSLECHLAVLWLRCSRPSFVMGGKLRKGSVAADTSGIMNELKVPPHLPIYH